MNSCRSTLIVDVYDVVPWQSPGGTTFHDVNGAKLSWLAVCILAVVEAKIVAIRSLVEVYDLVKACGLHKPTHLLIRH